MANNVIDWAFQFTLPHHLEKFALVALADDATKAGTCFYIGSMRNLARLLNVSERQARRVMRNLEEYGLVLTTPQERNNGSSSTNVYQLRTAIDPKTWKAPGRLAGKRGRSHIMSTWNDEAFAAAMAPRIDTQSFNTWFRPLNVAAIEKNRLILRVPNPFFVEYWRDRAALLLDVVRTLNPDITKLHFLIDRE